CWGRTKGFSYLSHRHITGAKQDQVVRLDLCTNQITEEWQHAGSIARRTIRMTIQLCPSLSWLVQNEGKRRSFLTLEVNRQLEPVRKQRLQHQAHLVLRRIAFSRRINRIPITSGLSH